jgi:hypothetical protein
VAALPTPDPRPDSRDGESDPRVRLLRELGEQVVPAWAALDSRAAEGARLVVVERVEREAFDDGEIADWIRDARRLSALEHPNVARVRDVVIRRSDVLVVSEFVDGVRWTNFAASAPLETALRVLVDALTGLSAIHNLRDPGDPRRQPFKLVHSGLTPDCIVVGLDGVSRVVGASRPRSATARLAGSGSAYLAPEVLLEDESADARADIYSVGVLLWEALSGKRFLPDMQPSAIVTQLLGGRVPAVTVPEASPWAAPLADVVMRALSADPEKRFSSAAAMSAEVRRIGALKVPLAIRLAADVREAFGDTAKARREELERGEVRPSAISLRASRPPVEELSIDETEELPEASPSASTIPPPMAPDEGAGRAVPAPIATPAPPQAPAGRRQGMLRIVAAAFAVLMVGGGIVWVASRGPTAHPAAAADVPPAVARSASDSVRESVIEPPAPTASEPAAAPTTVGTSAPPMPAASTAPVALGSTRIPAPPAPVVHSPLPASPAPARPKRSPAHREYDPQGI